MSKELDKLPDKWYIKVTKENQELCNKWRGFNTKISIDKYMYNELPDYNKRGVSKDEIIKGYLEITFDQFKKWVLKEESKFEVGCWYEIGNPKRIYINIVKVKNILSDTKIESEIGYYNIKGTNIDNMNLWVNEDGIWSDIDYYNKLSLEEIQQYLPEDHPDKLLKQLTINDLIEGEIYFDPNEKNPQWASLFLKNGNNFLHRLYTSDSYKGNRFNLNSIWRLSNCEKDGFRLATIEEKKWLTVCAKQNKFIPQDQLDKYNDEGDLIMEIPEYVELLKGWCESSDNKFVGEIFDTKKDFQSQFKKFKGITKSWDWKFILTVSNHKNYFKPSTKSAYDAQFKKDDEFKVGDWAYTDEFGVGSFKILRIEGRNIYNSSCGWVHKENVRHATQQEIDSLVKKDKQKEITPEDLGIYMTTGVHNVISSIQGLDLGLVKKDEGFISRNIPKREVNKRSNLKGLKGNTRFKPQPINKRSIY